MSDGEASPEVQAVVTLALLGVLGGLLWILIRPRLHQARRAHRAHESALEALPFPYRPRRPPAGEAAIMTLLILAGLLLFLLSPQPLTVALSLTATAVSIFRHERLERRRRRWMTTDLRRRARSLTPLELDELLSNLQRVYSPNDFRQFERALRPSPPH